VITGEDDPEIFDDSPGEMPDVTDATTSGAPSASAPEDPGGTVADTSAPSEAGVSVSIEPGASTFREVEPDDYSDAALGGYSPTALETSVGVTVTWTNDDTTVHTVTAPDGSFDSGNIMPGETWSHTFTERGEFNYSCTPHPWMRGRVVVG